MSIEVYPVVHAVDTKQMITQSTVALDAGADGIYLINHGALEDDEFLYGYDAVKAQCTDAFIGINMLNGSAFTQARMLREANNSGLIAALPDGLWVDNAADDPEEFVKYRDEFPSLKSIRYLGGVAFKYTPQFSEDPHMAAMEAQSLCSFVDVVTTSGKGTGSPPSPAKLRAMKAVIGDQKLAVASGINANNIHDYPESVSQILVASSIETEPYSGIFDIKKVKQLIYLAHSA